MQIKHIALASMALIASVQAQAVTRVSGASSLSNAYVKTLYDACTANGGTTDVYFSPNPGQTTAYTLGNIFTVACTGATFDNTETEVRFDVTGGSLNAILFSTAGASEALAGNGQFILAGGGLAVVAPPVLSFLNSAASTALHFKLNGPGETAKSVGGLMDIEPAIFQQQGLITGGDLDYSAGVTPAVFSQTFAVGVSPALYTALQTAQGLTPSVNNTLPAQQPSLSMAQIATLINNDNHNQAKTLGASFLAPGAVPANTPIYYCRLPSTSGTQQAAEIYFLKAVVATGDLGGALIIHGPSSPSTANGLVTNAGANGKIVFNADTYSLKRCLNGTAGAPTGSYAVGIVSATNNPLADGDAYRLVKVQGAEVSQGTTTASQVATAITGKYDFVFESVVFDADLANSGTANPILNLLSTSLGTPVRRVPGLFLNGSSTTPESKFMRFHSLSPYFSR